MFKIKREQMDVLRQAGLEGFVERMREHLSDTFPRETRELGQAALEETIWYCIARAETHEVTSERDVCLYLGLMLVFGRDFDRELPWAREILEDRSVPRPTERMDRLQAEGEARAAEGDPELSEQPEEMEA